MLATLLRGVHRPYLEGMAHRPEGNFTNSRFIAALLPEVGGSTGDEYFKTVCDYAHLNPVRAALLKLEDTLLAYPWTSLGWYAAAREHRPPWICVDRLFGTHGIPATRPRVVPNSNCA